jgi:hypothetical protein
VCGSEREPLLQEGTLRTTTRRIAVSTLLATVLVVPLAVTTSADAAPTDRSDSLGASDVVVQAPPPGYREIEQDFYVQNRTGKPLGQRYTFSGGVHTTRVFAGEERVEMRWDGWPDQRKEHMWEGDIRIERGSGRACVMQIKSNADGEPIYIQLFNSNGDLRNNGDSSAVATGMYDTWFNLRASFDPSSGLARAWINDRLVKTRQYRKGTSGWYFKNGAYNNGISAGGRAVTQFRNIHIYQRI